jgi:hypothetical protein
MPMPCRHVRDTRERAGLSSLDSEGLPVRELLLEHRMAHPHPIEFEIAALAHRLWCERMNAKGWTYGAEYSAARRMHDALVPFSSLSSRDQRDTVLGVMSLELIDSLQEMVDYPRGPDRELSTDELRVGMRVMPPDNAVEYGTVLSWEPDPDWPGSVLTIRVRWVSGDIIDHPAAGREICPAE